MRKQGSLLVLGLGLALLLFSAARLGVHASRIRQVEFLRFRYGALEDSIVAQNGAIAAAADQSMSAPLNHDDTTRKRIAAALARARYQKFVAQANLGPNSSRAEAERLQSLTTLRAADDAALALALLLLLIGLLLHPFGRKRSQAARPQHRMRADRCSS